jgi:hypothetical protein
VNTAKDMSTIQCYKCGKRGHYERDCKSSKKDRRMHRTKGTAMTEQSVAMVALHGPDAEDAATKKATDDCIIGKCIEWILDSGTSAHIVNDMTVARNIKVMKQKVAMFDGTVVDGTQVSITLHDVLLVPEAPYNLLSHNAVQDRSIEVHVKGKTMCLLYDGRVVTMAWRDAKLSGLPVIKMWARKMQLVAVAVAVLHRKLSAAELWHGRFGHLSYNMLARIAKYGSVKGLTASEKAF